MDQFEILSFFTALQSVPMIQISPTFSVFLASTPGHDIGEQRHKALHHVLIDLLILFTERRTQKEIKSDFKRGCKMKYFKYT